MNEEPARPPLITVVCTVEVVSSCWVCVIDARFEVYKVQHFLIEFPVDEQTKAEYEPSIVRVIEPMPQVEPIVIEPTAP